MLKIKEAIKAHGLSVNEVAERMGINRVTLSSHINGNPSAEILMRIATAIGCSVSELFGEGVGTNITCPHCGKPISIHLGVGD